MLENQVEQRLCRQVKRLGGIALKLLPGGYAGLPDRLVLLPGARVFFIETKAPGIKLRLLQAKWARILRGLGFDARKLDSIELVDAFIDEVTGGGA